MPLDSGAYLKSLGWQGSGNGLRQDGMAKPLAIPQKRTLSGVGKDRDEAFPFWDHLFPPKSVFNAAANSIKIKIHSDDSGQSDVESEQSNTPELTLSRTSTGIISNRRPASSTPVGSGSATPKEVPNKSRLSLLAQAKRQAAYARLYASFYKGPVITPLKDEISPAINKEEETKKRYTHDITVDSQTNISSWEGKDHKSCRMTSPVSSRKRKKKSSKDKKLDKTKTPLPEDSNQSSDERKDKLTKKRHKPTEAEVTLEQDLDNKKDSKRKRKHKNDTIGEEAEESTSKQKEGSKKKKRRLEDGDDNQGKRKKTKKTINGSTVNPQEYVLKPSHDKDEEQREKGPKERKKARTS